MITYLLKKSSMLSKLFLKLNLESKLEIEYDFQIIFTRNVSQS